MCAVAKCKSKKFSLFSTFAVAFSCSFFVAFLSLKTTKKIFDLTSYFPQKRTLWPGQSLSSPIRRRFFDPPNGAIRWMHQYVCIRLNTSAYVCLVNSPSRSVHLFNLSHSVHLLHLPHSIPVNYQKMILPPSVFPVSALS